MDRQGSEIHLLLYRRFDHFTGITLVNNACLALYKLIMKRFSWYVIILFSILLDFLWYCQTMIRVIMRLYIKSILTKTIEIQSDTIASIKHLNLKIQKKLLNFVFQIEINIQHPTLCHIQRKDLKVWKEDILYIS